MSIGSRIARIFQSATRLLRPALPAHHVEPGLWASEDSPATVSCVRYNAGTGQLEYVDLTGGAGGDKWGKYTVSNQASVTAAYSTVQSAIDAAVAEGHTGAQGLTATVFVLGGAFAESITAYPGVAVVGITGTNGAFATPGTPVINGTITVADLAGPYAFAGLAVDGGAGACLDVPAGANPGKVVTVDRCTFATTGNAVALGEAGSQLVLRRSSVAAGGVYAVALFDATSDLIADDCTIAAAQDTGLALALLGAFTVRRGSLTGRLLADGAAAVGRVEDTRIQALTQSAVRVNDGGGVVWYGGIVRHTTLNPGTDYAVDSSSGGGTWSDGGACVDSNRLIQSTVTQNPLRVALHGKRAAFSGAGPYAPVPGNAALLNSCDPGVNVGVAFGLPTLATFQAGELCYVANVAAATGTVVLTPAGGQTVAGLATLTLYAGEAALLVADPATSAWRVEGRFAPNSVGLATGGATTYYNGTIVPATSKAVNFTASPGVSRYYLTADTLTIILDSADPIGQTYEFWSTTGAAAPGHTFAPNGGATINGAATVPYSRQWGGQVVTKTGAATWQMAT